MKGSCSDWCSVTSSVPQGSVGGPTQFSLYIDDMVDGIDSRMIQFADDTKMWRRVTCQYSEGSLFRHGK